ncbi:MAG: M23 family metallopeptidase [Gemmatimonadales bacterium]|nr:M23 family metallopeptidase [Gemmatimonadales bacterium]
MAGEPRAPREARKDEGAIRFLVVREAQPVREWRIHRATLVRGATWLIVGAWVLPTLLLAGAAGKARLERDNLAADVSLLTQRAESLAASIAELERYAGLGARRPEGGPVSVAPTRSADVLDGASKWIGFLWDRFHTVASGVRARAERVRGTPTGQPLPDTLAGLSSSFGWRANPFSGDGAEWHAGLDFPAPEGTPVQATADGIVESTGWRDGYGLAVIVRNADDYQTIFGHLSAIDVREGDRLSRGTVLGRVGSTGRSTGPHLHYEVRRAGRPLDPRDVRPPVLPNERPPATPAR